MGTEVSLEATRIQGRAYSVFEMIDLLDYFSRFVTQLVLAHRSPVLITLQYHTKLDQTNRRRQAAPNLHTYTTAFK